MKSALMILKIAQQGQKIQNTRGMASGLAVFSSGFTPLRFFYIIKTYAEMDWFA